MQRAGGGRHDLGVCEDRAEAEKTDAGGGERKLGEDERRMAGGKRARDSSRTKKRYVSVRGTSARGTGPER